MKPQPGDATAQHATDGLRIPERLQPGLQRNDCAPIMNLCRLKKLNW